MLDEAYPKRPNGGTFFTFLRIFVVAQVDRSIRSSGSMTCLTKVSMASVVSSTRSGLSGASYGASAGEPLQFAERALAPRPLGSRLAHSSTGVDT